MKLLLNIDVPEIATAEAFYTAAFGLHAGRRFGADGLELLGLEAPLYLLAKPKAAPARANRRAPMRDTGRRCIAT